MVAIVSKVELLSPACRAEIDAWLAKYPVDQRRSAVIPALHVVQDANNGYLTDELTEAVADYLQIPRIWAFEVATFYSMYEQKPVGRHKIGVCCSICCQLRGAKELSEHLKQKLGIGFGETTDDGKFTLKHVECLGACVDAPVLQLGKEYHAKVTPEKVDTLLEKLP